MKKIVIIILIIAISMLCIAGEADRKDTRRRTENNSNNETNGKFNKQQNNALVSILLGACTSLLSLYFTSSYMSNIFTKSSPGIGTMILAYAGLPLLISGIAAYFYADQSSKWMLNKSSLTEKDYDLKLQELKLTNGLSFYLGSFLFFGLAISGISVLYLFAMFLNNVVFA